MKTVERVPERTFGPDMPCDNGDDADAARNIDPFEPTATLRVLPPCGLLLDLVPPVLHGYHDL
ncbi:hypothetical protein TomMM35A_12100 [Sphingobium sp. TomMM35A]